MIRSTDGQVRELIDALGTDDPARREAAIARLNIIGSRAVARLIATYEHTDERPRQLAILRVLETSADERAFPVVRDALAAGGDLAVAAVAVLRELLGRPGPTQVAALDLLLAASNDVTTARRVRAAAAQALTGAPADVRSAVARQFPDTGSADDAVWEDAVEERLPEDPAVLRDAMDGHAEQAPLPVLRRIVEAVRGREEAEAGRASVKEWRELRGALHKILACRGSRIALYDLRETLERTGEPLPASFLDAIGRIGDESCLQAVATALSQAPPRDLRWRHELAQAFRAIATRERLTARHAAMRRALARAPELKGA